jgi:hypothetical protein
MISGSRCLPHVPPEGATEIRQRFQSGAHCLDRFLCSTWSSVSSPRPAVVQSRRAQELSRLADALRRTPPLPGHTLTASSTTARLVRSG